MSELSHAAGAFFAVWCVNDAEEWFTYPGTTKRLLRRLPRWLPVPEAVRQRGLSPAHTRRAIALMGVAALTSGLAGVATHGRSALFRGALLALGVHGYLHLGLSVAARGYTSGAASAATVVIPYWHWSRRVLARHGLSDHDGPAVRVALLALPLLAAVHAVTFAMMGDDALGPADRAEEG